MLEIHTIFPEKDVFHVCSRCDCAVGSRVCVCVGLDSCSVAHTDLFLWEYGLWHTAVWHQVLDATWNAQCWEVMLKRYTAWQQRTQTPLLLLQHRNLLNCVVSNRRHISFYIIQINMNNSICQIYLLRCIMFGLSCIINIVWDACSLLFGFTREFIMFVSVPRKTKFTLL